MTPNGCAFITAGLRRLGITRATRGHVDNVHIEKDNSGEPTGRLRGSVTIYYCDSPFMNELLRQLPIVQLDKVVAGTERAMRSYNRMGVTTVYEGHAMGFEQIEVYRWLRQEDRLSVRVLCAPEVEPYGTPWSPEPLDVAEYRQRLDRARDLVDRSDPWSRVDGATIGRGGPCWPGFLLMHEPYRGPYGEVTTGRSFVSTEKIELAIRYCHEHGVRLNIVTAAWPSTTTTTTCSERWIKRRCTPTGERGSRSTSTSSNQRRPADSRRSAST